MQLKYKIIMNKKILLKYLTASYTITNYGIEFMQARAG